MSKKRTRYSAKLAADWIIPMPPAEETMNRPEQKESDDSLSEKSASGPTKTNDNSPSTENGSTPSDASKKFARYKKVVPSSWIARNTDGDPVMERDSMLTVESNDQLLKFKERRLSTRLAHGMDMSAGYDDDRGLEPPPAPTRAEFNLRKPLYEREVLPPFKSGSYTNDSIPRDQVASGPLAGFHNWSLASASPQVSVGQQSSGTNESPYGRDVPARGPSISPAYSIV